MGSWFDERAKASARAESSAGLSRRQVLQRGAVVAGAAWTAPMLLTATPAWAGASQCPNDYYQPCPVGAPNPFECCPNDTDICFIVTDNKPCQTPLGGMCGNSGNGNCNGNTARCNSRPKPNNICGGPGSICAGGKLCAGANGLPDPTRCSAIDFECGGQGTPCGSSADCALANTGGDVDMVCRNIVPLTGVGTCLP